MCTGLDLKELERWWACIREGRADEYHGPAVHPRHLSWWEIYVQRRHKQYNAEKHAAFRMQELKVGSQGCSANVAVLD